MKERCVIDGGRELSVWLKLSPSSRNSIEEGREVRGC